MTVTLGTECSSHATPYSISVASEVANVSPIIINVACSAKHFYPAITLIDHDKCEEEIGLNLFEAQVHYIPKRDNDLLGNVYRLM